MKHRNLGLYLCVLLLATGVVIAALGGGLFGQQQPWPFEWQHRFFAGLCHQMPSRSFWISGQPMAVCSRCFGIYSGFWLGWVMLPWTSYVDISSLYPHGKMLFAFILLNFIDVLGNWLGFWHNTLVSRLLLGGLMGTGASQLFTGVFFIKIKTNTKGYYGAITTSRSRAA